MTEEKKSYYAIIPANVRYDETLSANAKLLYGEITALCNAEGHCWASNKYFAELYNVSHQSITNWVGQLSKHGYIRTKLIYKEGTKEILDRYITLIIDPTQKNLGTPTQKILGDNNTDKNNTFNNIYRGGKRTSRFVPPTLEEVKEYCIERKNNVNAERFIDYYTANGWHVGKNKMRDWKAAVRRWEQNGVGDKKETKRVFCEAENQKDDLPF